MDFSKLKEFTDDNFKIDESGRKFFKREENTVGKAEIACYSVFKRLVLQTHKNQGLFGKGLISNKIEMQEMGEKAEICTNTAMIYGFKRNYDFLGLLLRKQNS